MNFSEHLSIIDDITEKQKQEKRKKEIFDMTKESADELYVKSCGADDDSMEVNVI